MNTSCYVPFVTVRRFDRLYSTGFATCSISVSCGGFLLVVVVVRGRGINSTQVLSEVFVDQAVVVLSSSIILLTRATLVTCPGV